MSLQIWSSLSQWLATVANRRLHKKSDLGWRKSTRKFEWNGSYELEARMVLSGVPPTISAIPDITIAEDHASPELLFTVKDPDTPASELVITTHSSNTVLIPADNISLESHGSDHLLRIRPADDKYGGPATVEVRVSDGTNTAKEAIRVTVTPVNDPPTTVGLLDVRATSGGAATVIDLFKAFDDLEDADNQLTYSVTGNSNPALFSSIAIDQRAGTLTLKTAPSANGTAELTLRATDRQGAYVERSSAQRTVPVYYRFYGSEGVDYPELRELGLQPLTFVSYFALFDRKDNVYDFSDFRESKLTWALSDFFADVDPSIPVSVNIELHDYDNSVQGRNNLAEVIHLAQRIRPDLEFGYYSLLPERNWWVPIQYDKLQRDLAAGLTTWYTNRAEALTNAYIDWTKRNAAYRTQALSPQVGGGTLAGRVDSIQPSLYTFYRSQLAKRKESVGVTFNGTTDTILSIGHSFHDGDAIRFVTPNLPLGLNITTTYFVLNANEDSFQLALESQAGAVNFAAGSARANIAFPWTPYEADPDVANWDVYAQYNIAEARKFNKPVYAWLSPSMAGAGVIHLDEQFFLQQLRTTAALADGVILWEPSLRTEDFHLSQDWYRALKTFMKENTSPDTALKVTVVPPSSTITTKTIPTIKLKEDSAGSAIDLDAY
ncbi:MAG: hypothetical protein KDA99_18675, partial [Planctomycetales bacterium]|nr:hypothetical protein [Planctomycetales bacterium]